MLLCTDMLLECIREGLSRDGCSGRTCLQDPRVCTIPVVRDVIKGYRCPSRSFKHTEAAVEFMTDNYDAFFQKVNGMIAAKEYVVQSRCSSSSVKYCSTGKTFQSCRGTSEKPNAVLIMKCLRSKKSSIAFEAFQIFKIFVMNPKKPDSIRWILENNGKKLIAFLSRFQSEKDDDDEQFADEKVLLMEKIEEIMAQPSSLLDAAAPSQSSSAAAEQ